MQQRLATIEVTKALQLTVSQVRGGEVSVALTRITAQNLARALLEYVGVEERSVTLGHPKSVTFGAHDVTPLAPQPDPVKKVKLGRPARRVSVGR